MGWKGSRAFFHRHGLLKKCVLEQQEGPNAGDHIDRPFVLKGARVAIDIHKWLHEQLGSKKYRSLDDEDDPDTDEQTDSAFITAVFKKDRGVYKRKVDGIILEEIHGRLVKYGSYGVIPMIVFDGIESPYKQRRRDPSVAARIARLRSAIPAVPFTNYVTALASPVPTLFLRLINRSRRWRKRDRLIA
jgi:hypothetical protein